jgi:hypothetical protein
MDWETRLLDVNIIISKELTDSMIMKLVSNKDKIIFHHTITGHGGTEVEPGVKSPEHEFEQFKKLLAAGFPLKQYVLRLDPIIPYTVELMTKSIAVLEMYHNYATENRVNILVRLSLIDCYPHVREAFKSIGIINPWNTFHCPPEIFTHLNDLLKRYVDRLAFESCCEPNFNFKGSVVYPTPCASVSDVANLLTGDSGIFSSDKLDEIAKEYTQPEKPQRSTCHCLAKKQILGVKPGRCSHNCVYCYWKP